MSRSCADFLRPLIWSLDGSVKAAALDFVRAKLGKSVTDPQEMIRQAFGEGSRARTRKVQTHRGTKKERQVKSKVKSMLIISFDIKGAVYKESILAGQTVNPTYYFYFYGDCATMCLVFDLKYADKSIGCCITTTHRLELPISAGSFLTKKKT
jgi:hypothetical protein